MFKDRIAELLSAGLDLEGISAKLGLKKNSIYKRLNREGWSLGHRSVWYLEEKRGRRR